MKKTMLNKPLVIVVDMINGFVHEGALSDARIDRITPNIENLLKDGTEALFICDAHSEDAREFKAYPVHCLKGTKESEIVEQLKPYVTDTIEKNSINTFSAPGFQKRLKSLLEDYQDFVITGCCTDLCVLQLVLSFQSYLNEINDQGHRILVPKNCVETYHAPQVHDAAYWNEAALKNMAANGVCVVEKIED